MTSQHLSTLSNSPIFRGLSTDELAKSLQEVGYQVKHFPPKVIVAEQGSACNFLMLILSGSVQGQMIDYSGKLIVIEELVAPMPVAPAFLYADRNEFPVNVVATSECCILFIAKSNFTALLQGHAAILQNYLTIISNRSKFLSNKIMFLNFKNLKSKIAAFLLQKQHEQQSLQLRLTETQQDLADYLGVARPSLARVLKEMKDEQLIEIQGKTVVLLNLAKLKQEAL